MELTRLYLKKTYDIEPFSGPTEDGRYAALMSF